MSPFEEQLRSLQPSSCDQLTESTFYQAGWKAAEAALASRASSQKKSSRPVHSFVTGLVCGLLVSVASLFNWQSTSTENVLPVASETSAEEKTQPPPTPAAAVAEEDKTAIDIAVIEQSVESDPQLQTELTRLFPWNLIFQSRVPEPVPAEMRPLSAVSRRFGSSVVAADSSLTSHPRDTRTNDDLPDLRPLRSGPLTEEIANELL